MPRHPPYATITWPLQITRCSRTLFTNQNTNRTPKHHSTHPTLPGQGEEPRVLRGGPREPTNGCFLRHPTARPPTLLDRWRQSPILVKTIPNSPGSQRAPRPGPLSSPTSTSIKTLACERLLRKEVIQPHLPVRLPCYDFVPIASPTFTHSLPEGLGHKFRVLPTFMT